MEYSRILLALEELSKWKERRRRVEERLHRLQVRKRFLLRELALAQERRSHFTALVAAMRTERAAPARIVEPGALR